MHPAITKLKGMLSNLKSSEVAEALIATWCVEYLRVRRLGGFNVVEIMAISLLMLSVKAIVTEASRRRYSDTNRTFVMSRRNPQMGGMGVYRGSARTYPGFRGSHGPRRFNLQKRRAWDRDPYQDL